MEVVLVFLAITVIQMIAAYSKQKKEEAAKRAAPQPNYEEEEQQEFFEEPTVEEVIFKKEELPFESITARKSENTNYQLETPQLQPDFKLNIGSPENGILWIAILNEPRYRVKWKRR